MESAQKTSRTLPVEQPSPSRPADSSQIVCSTDNHGSFSKNLVRLPASDYRFNLACDRVSEKSFLVIGQKFVSLEVYFSLQEDGGRLGEPGHLQVDSGFETAPADLERRLNEDLQSSSDSRFEAPYARLSPMQLQQQPHINCCLPTAASRRGPNEVYGVTYAPEAPQASTHRLHASSTDHAINPFGFFFEQQLGGTLCSQNPLSRILTDAVCPAVALAFPSSRAGHPASLWRSSANGEPLNCYEENLLELHPSDQYLDSTVFNSHMQDSYPSGQCQTPELLARQSSCWKPFTRAHRKVKDACPASLQAFPTSNQASDPAFSRGIGQSAQSIHNKAQTDSSNCCEEASQSLMQDNSNESNEIDHLKEPEVKVEKKTPVSKYQLFCSTKLSHSSMLEEAHLVKKYYPPLCKLDQNVCSQRDQSGVDLPSPSLQSKQNKAEFPLQPTKTNPKAPSKQTDPKSKASTVSPDKARQRMESELLQKCRALCSHENKLSSYFKSLEDFLAPLKRPQDQCFSSSDKLSSKAADSTPTQPNTKSSKEKKKLSQLISLSPVEVLKFAEKGESDCKAVLAYLKTLSVKDCESFANAAASSAKTLLSDGSRCKLLIVLLSHSAVLRQVLEKYCLQNLFEVLSSVSTTAVLLTLAESSQFSQAVFTECQKIIEQVVVELNPTMAVSALVNNCTNESAVSFLIDVIDKKLQVPESTHAVNLIAPLIDRISGQNLNRVAQIVNFHMSWLIDDSVGVLAIQNLLKKRSMRTIQKFKKQAFEQPIICMFTKRNQKLLLKQAIEVFDKDKEFFVRVLRDLMMNTSSLRSLFKNEESAWLFISVLLKMQSRTKNILSKVKRRVSRVAEELEGEECYLYWRLIVKYLDLFISNDYNSMMFDEVC